MVSGSYQQALDIYRELFDQYSFVFLRDHKIATQLAWYLGHQELAFQILESAIANGWNKKSLRKNSFLKPMKTHRHWKQTMASYDSLVAVYQSRIDTQLRSEVRSMSLRDQRKAMGALLKFRSDAQDKYAEEKFARHNEKHLLRLLEIIDEQGYPAEKLIGFDPWAQGIFSRHNSISQAYCQKDTLFSYAKPKLMQAISKGEMPPGDLAYIEDWFITVKSGWKTASYGYLVELKEEDLAQSNQLRKQIGLRPVEVNHGLFELQERLGMDFYLRYGLAKVEQ